MTQTRVAKAAGVRQSHLTYYFPRKNDLLVAVSGVSLDRLAEELSDFFGQAGWQNANQTMRERVISLSAFIVKDRARTRLTMSLLVAAEEEPELRTALADVTDHARRLVALGFGLSPEDPKVELRLAAFWGISLQYLLMEGPEGDAKINALITRVFDEFGTSAS